MPDAQLLIGSKINVQKKKKDIKGDKIGKKSRA